MRNSFTSLPRRTFLKGLGATMALPMLEAMAPRAAATTETAVQPPTRMAFIYFPNGRDPRGWKLEGTGRDFLLSSTLEPLAEHKSELLFVSGLAQDQGREKGDGGGDHARGVATFLTGARPYKTAGKDIRLGISADQLAANLVGRETRLPSLELGVDRSRTAGKCDSGYSCAYTSNISWRTANAPVAKEINPRLAFERLFGSPDEDPATRSRREQDRRSILDLVADDAARLKDQLGWTDRRKIDEYFTSVRELELRIERAQHSPRSQPPHFEVPAGIPSNFEEHVRVMFDLLALAFQTDSTRVATFMLGNAGSDRVYDMLGIKEGHHTLTHHSGEPEKIEAIQKIDRYLVTQYAYFLKKLRSIPEGDGTLLDHSMIVYGSGLGDGSQHTHHDLPIVIAGRGGGTIEPGRHLPLSSETPLNNLYLSMLDRMGANIERFGDSTGRLAGLDG